VLVPSTATLVLAVHFVQGSLAQRRTQSGTRG
jgi:hypothetical protein